MHPLHKLTPDTWNNIPVCLVKAVKMLIDANISTDQRLRALQAQTENNQRKAGSQLTKVEKDLQKKEEQLRAGIERSEKHLVGMMQQKFHETESVMSHLKETLNDVITQVNKATHDFNERIDLFMDGDQIRDHVQWTID